MKLFKFVLIILFSSINLIIIYFYFFSPKETQLKIAESIQGTYLSDKIFNNLINKNINYDEAYMQRSIAYNKRGEYNKGFLFLDKAVELNPEIHLGYRGWLKLVKLRDYDGAIYDLKTLDSLTPNFNDYPWGENIHYLLAIAYSGNNDTLNAISEFNKYYNSEDETFINPMAYIYHANLIEKNIKNAIKFINKGLILNKYQTEAYYYKSLYFLKNNQLDSAKYCINKADSLLNRGYKNKGIYNEEYKELYKSDIDSLSKLLQ